MNWGYKIVVGGALFMLFIIGMSVVMIMRSEDDELIEKDYYQKGLKYDTDYDAQRQAMEDVNAPLIQADTAGLKVVFSVASSYQLECKRPSNAHLDQSFKGQVKENEELRISRTDLAPGPWLISLSYQNNGKSHLIKREIMLP